MAEFTSEQLGKISPAAERGSDNLAESSKERLENAVLVASGRKEIAEAVRKELENEDYKTEIESRRKYAKCIFRLVAWWAAAILMILLLQGFLGKDGTMVDWTFAGANWTGIMRFDLSENIILALIGGTTAGVIGLFKIVAQHFFPEK